MASAGQRRSEAGRRLGDVGRACRAGDRQQGRRRRRAGIVVLQRCDQPQRNAFIAADMVRAEREASERAGSASAQRADEMRQLGEHMPALPRRRAVLRKAPASSPMARPSRCHSQRASGGSLRAPVSPAAARNSNRHAGREWREGAASTTGCAPREALQPDAAADGFDERNARRKAGGDKRTKCPPIERVQGPDIKGCACTARSHKATARSKVNENLVENALISIA